MAMTKIKTVGIDQQTGLSRLAVTPKKKSKMKKIIPAVIAGAALAAGVGAFGGTTAAAGGGSIFSKLGAGLKSLFGIGSKAAAADAISLGTSLHGGAQGIASTAKESGILGTLFEGITKAGSGIYDKFKGMSATDIYLAGQSLNIVSGLLSDEEDFSQQNFESQLQFEYDKLAAQQEIAMAELAAKNRANALAGTYMGFTSPTVANAEGVTTEKGYTPPRMPSPPTGGGGLLS